MKYRAFSKNVREEKDWYKKQSRQQKRKRRTGTKNRAVSKNVREGWVRKTEPSAKT